MQWIGNLFSKKSGGSHGTSSSSTEKETKMSAEQKAAAPSFAEKVTGQSTKELSPENFPAETVTYKDVAVLSNDQRRAIMKHVGNKQLNKLNTLRERGLEGVEVLLSLYGSLKWNGDSNPDWQYNRNTDAFLIKYYDYFIPETFLTLPLGDRKKLIEYLTTEDLQNVAKNNYKAAFVLCASLEKSDTTLINKLKPVFEELSQTVHGQIHNDSSLYRGWGKTPGIPISSSDFERLSQTELGSLVLLSATLAFAEIGVRPFYGEEPFPWPDVKPMVERALRNVDPNLEIAKRCHREYNIDQYREELNQLASVKAGKVLLKDLTNKVRGTVINLLTCAELADFLRKGELQPYELPREKWENVILDELTNDDLRKLIMEGRIILNKLDPFERWESVVGKLTNDDLMKLIMEGRIQIWDCLKKSRKPLKIV
jgi:hypothetical protein